MTSASGATWCRAAVLAGGLGAAALVLGGQAVAEAAPTDRDGATAAGTAASASRTARAVGERTAGPGAARSTIRPAGSAVTTAAHAATVPAPGPLRAFGLAIQAYTYGYPLLEFERFRSAVPSLNTLTSFTTFAKPDTVPIWRPNTDTLYSRAVLDLADGPVVLSVPDMGDRYYSFQLNDPYTNVTSYIGSRTTGSGPGSYAIAWDGGPQTTVEGAQTVSVPYRSMMLLGRTLAGDEADQQQAVALMNQYRLAPTGAAGAPPAATPAPSGLDLLDAISAAMELHPPPARDAEQLAALAQIGVGAGLRVADANLGPLSRLAADLAVRTAEALLPILSALNQFGTAFRNGGWATPDPAIGNYGTNYELRAGVIYVGPWANTPEEAIYSAGLLDADRLPLNGANSYLLRFGPGDEPPADAFWSVTVYDENGALVANPQNRYSVSSSRPDELLRRPDGTVDIIFSRTDPGDAGANWLPVPDAPFSAYLRMYVPSQAALDGSWTPPAIQRRN
ncbi:MAG: DUF1254 domain-containing protein [Mycobacterium sp.]|nr:DUF1254 domain-containing protein [Mycobacterium sp.]